MESRLLRRVCVFCGSALGSRPVYAERTREFGSLLAKRNIGLVYGGGNIGLMGVLADAVLAGGGKVIGVIPKALVEREVAHHGVTELRVVQTMHERKALMADLADAFIALPGGFGTLEEFFEVLTWGQLGFHRKPCGLLDVEGFFAPLFHALDRMVAEGFLRTEHRQLILGAPQAGALLPLIENFTPVPDAATHDSDPR